MHYLQLGAPTQLLQSVQTFARLRLINCGSLFLFVSHRRKGRFWVTVRSVADLVDEFWENTISKGLWLSSVFRMHVAYYRAMCLSRKSEGEKKCLQNWEPYLSGSHEYAFIDRSVVDVFIDDLGWQNVLDGTSVLYAVLRSLLYAIL